MNIQDICIQGDPQRGKDIIKFFEVMGVKNRINMGCDRDHNYYYAIQSNEHGLWIGAIEQTKKTLIRLQPNSLLPERWCVRGTSPVNYLNKKTGAKLYGNQPRNYYGEQVDSKRLCDPEPFGLELTEQQFLALSGYKPEQKEQREIVGYKCPMDMWNGNVKKGDVFKWDAGDRDYLAPCGFALPAEIVEQWEPVYKEEPIMIAGSEVELLQKYVHWNGDAMSYHTFGELMSALKVFKATHLTISGEQVPVEILQSIQSKLK